jgi:hypothetical protein
MGHDTVAPPGAPNAFGRTALQSMEAKFAAHPADNVSGNATLGKVTLLGASASGEFAAGSVTGFVRQAVEHLPPGLGHDTTLGSQRADALGFLKAPHSSTGLIADFVSGQDKVHLQAASLESLKSRSDASVSSHGGNTYISLDGGKTTIELHGVAHLKPSGIDPHRH